MINFKVNNFFSNENNRLLYNNKLNGSIPTELGNLRSLTEL